MCDNASYVGDCQIQDEGAVSAYPLISSNLQQQHSSEDFMDIITDTLIIIPSFIGLEQVLYIIDDKYSRSQTLKSVSGREMLASEIEFLNQFNDNSEDLLKFFSRKCDIQLTDANFSISSEDDLDMSRSDDDKESPMSDWRYSLSGSDDDDDADPDSPTNLRFKNVKKTQMKSVDLLKLMFEINYCYHACYELRNFVNEMHAIKLQFQKEMAEKLTKK